MPARYRTVPKGANKIKLDGKKGFLVPKTRWPQRPESRLTREVRSQDLTTENRPWN